MAWTSPIPKPAMNNQSPQAFVLGREGVPLHLTQPQLALFTHTVSDSFLHSCSARHTLMHTGMITHLSITCTVTYTTVCIPDQYLCLETHCTHWALCTLVLTHTYASIPSRWQFIHIHLHPYTYHFAHTHAQRACAH